MKVYVAGRWTRKNEVRAMQALLAQDGHTITHDWTALEDPPPEWSGERTLAYLAEQAERDLRGVAEAEAVILLHDDTGRGLFVELGAALTDPRKHVIVVGAGPTVGSCVFYFLPGVFHVAKPVQATWLLWAAQRDQEAVPLPAGKDLTAGGA